MKPKLRYSSPNFHGFLLHTCISKQHQQNQCCHILITGAQDGNKRTILLYNWFLIWLGQYYAFLIDSEIHQQLLTIYITSNQPSSSHQKYKNCFHKHSLDSMGIKYCSRMHIVKPKRFLVQTYKKPVLPINSKQTWALKELN